MVDSRNNVENTNYKHVIGQVKLEGMGLSSLIAVGIGGFLGACARYGFSKGLSRFTAFPYGTLVSNIVAAFIIGLTIGMSRQSVWLPEQAKLFLTAGLSGGLSTFSTFSLETVTMLEQGNYIHAMGNVLLNVCLSIVFVLAGLGVAKLVIKT
ncbi:MAG: fluoride efflux transporter CrcB [Nitrososphaerota archaeon]|nr:fluoride efflux transporter CrcB [Nitrososphaerota archaeon]